jgi:hypothetical protein
MNKLGPKIASALLAGTLALSATAPAFADHADGYRDYWRGDSPRRAIEMCKQVAERHVSRNGWGRAEVTDIRDVRETRWGYEVSGRIAVNSRNHGWHDRDRWDRDGWSHNSSRGYDDGSFKCRVERGRIADLDINGIRGL